MSIINAGIEPQLFEYLKEAVANSPFYQLLGIKLALLGSGRSELEVQVKKDHTNPIGLVHGGLIMSIADAAMGNAIRSLGIVGVTADCSVAFPGSARMGEIITAKGNVIKTGKNLIFAEATVWAEDRVLGHSKATFFNTGNIEFHS